MVVTLDLKEIGYFLIGLGILVLIVFLIILFAHLIKMVKKTNRVLDNMETITDITADRAEEVNELVKNVSVSAEEIVTAIKGQQDVKKALAVLVNCFGAIRTLVNKFGGGKSEK